MSLWVISDCSLSQGTIILVLGLLVLYNPLHRDTEYGTGFSLSIQLPSTIQQPCMWPGGGASIEWGLHPWGSVRKPKKLIVITESTLVDSVPPFVIRTSEWRIDIALCLPQRRNFSNTLVLCKGDREKQNRKELCWLVFAQLTQTRVTCERETSIEQLFLSEWTKSIFVKVSSSSSGSGSSSRLHLEVWLFCIRLKTDNFDCRKAKPFLHRSPLHKWSLRKYVITRELSKGTVHTGCRRSNPLTDEKSGLLFLSLW